MEKNLGSELKNFILLSDIQSGIQRNLDYEIRRYLDLVKEKEEFLKLRDEAATEYGLASDNYDKEYSKYKEFEASKKRELSEIYEALMQEVEKYAEIRETTEESGKSIDIIVKLMGINYIIANAYWNNGFDKPDIYLDESSKTALSKFDRVVNLDQEYKYGIFSLHLKDYFKKYFDLNKTYEKLVEEYNKAAIHSDNKLMRLLFKSEFEKREKLSSEIEKLREPHEFYESNRGTTDAVLANDKDTLKKLMDADIEKYKQIIILIDKFIEQRNKCLDGLETAEQTVRILKDEVHEKEESYYTFENALRSHVDKTLKQFSNIEGYVKDLANNQLYTAKEINPYIDIIMNSGLTQEEKEKLYNSFASAMAASMNSKANQKI